MKTTSFIFLFIVISAFCGAQDGAIPFSVKGEVKNARIGFMVLSYLNAQKKEQNDTAQLDRGKFSFKGSIAHEHRGILRGYFEDKTTDEEYECNPFLERGEVHVKLVKENFNQALITGTPLNDELRRLEAKKAAGKANIKSLQASITTLEKSLKGDVLNSEKQRMVTMKAELQSLREAEKKLDYNYIISNPDQAYSAYLMDYYFSSRKLPLDSAKLFVSGFSKKVLDSYYGKHILGQIAARQNSAVGILAPDFVKDDINGKRIQLSEFKGKNYVLLDFWASWCVPCRAENPKLKSIYTKYASKGLEIVSISWDFNAAPWKKAITDDGTGSWRHVLASLNQPDDGSLRGRYSIASIPTLVLIDKTGKIIGRYRGAVGEGTMDDLEKDLSTMLTP